MPFEVLPDLLQYFYGTFQDSALKIAITSSAFFVIHNYLTFHISLLHVLCN
jgi:hypothetical protein